MNELMRILKDIRPDADFEKSENFIEDAYLDSLDLTNLIVTLEEICDVEIGIDQLKKENFISVSSILTMIKECGGNTDVLK